MKLSRTLERLVVFRSHGVLSSFTDHPGPPGEIQGAGSGADKDGTISCSPDTRTVPGILQTVYYMFRLRSLGFSYLFVLCVFSNASLFSVKRQIHSK